MRKLIVLFLTMCLFVSTAACGNMRESETTKETETMIKSSAEATSESVTEKKTEAVKRMIMIDGKIYVETGEEMTTITCGTFDGYIQSVVDKTEIPKKDGQANFGSKKIGYQIAGGGCIDVYIHKKWMRFEPENKAEILNSLNENLVEDVTVTLLSSNTTVKLKKEDIKKLINILKKIELKERDDSYSELVGQLVDITVTLIDGTQISIKELTPFIIINDVGYKAEYEPCEELNAFVNNLKKD